MLEWRRILSDPKRRITLICIPLVCLFLFFYQKCSGDFGALVTESAQYRQLLESYGQSTPAQIVEDLSGRWDISANEQQLLAQAEHLRDYVALHELIHFIHHDHGPGFYEKMDVLMPDWRQRRGQLKAFAPILIEKTE